MPYTPNVPLANQGIDTTQQTIRDNFTGIKTFVDVNHETFDSANEGKHKFLQMPVQGSAPTTGASELGVYAKNDGAGILRLFMREPSNGTERQISGAVVLGTSGETELFGGVKLKWAAVTGSQAGTSYTYAGLGLSNFTTAYGALGNLTEFAQSPGFITAFSTTGFTVRHPDASGNRTMFVIALGV